MALDTFVSGRYSSTYNSTDTGITESGYELSIQSSADVIDESDAYGGTALDFVYRGGNVFMEFLGLAYKAGAITPFWPWGAMGVLLTGPAPLGRLASNVAAAHVLTSVANTPAAAAPASLTGTKAILAPGYDAKLLYNSKLRKVPIRLQYLPYDATGGVFRWWAET